MNPKPVGCIKPIQRKKPTILKEEEEEENVQINHKSLIPRKKFLTSIREKELLKTVQAEKNEEKIDPFYIYINDFSELLTFGHHKFGSITWLHPIIRTDININYLKQNIIFSHKELQVEPKLDKQVIFIFSYFCTIKSY